MIKMYRCLVSVLGTVVKRFTFYLKLEVQYFTLRKFLFRSLLRPNIVCGQNRQFYCRFVENASFAEIFVFKSLSASRFIFQACFLQVSSELEKFHSRKLKIVYFSDRYYLTNLRCNNSLFGLLFSLSSAIYCQNFYCLLTTSSLPVSTKKLVCFKPKISLF